MSALAGRVAVVTGGTDGIGAATARALRSRGAEVVVLGRSREKADRLRPAGIRPVVADLSLMAEVVAAAAAVRDLVPRIDFLVHAVGVLLTRAEHTAEGLEKDFAVSYLSRYLFLEHAAGLGMLHPGTRLVNVAASAPRVPRIARMEFASLAEVEARVGLRGHGQAQLAADLLTAAAPGRYGITAVGYGPGAVATNIRREVPAVARAVLGPLYALATRRPDEAAADIVAALTDPDLPPGSATFRNRRGAFPPDPFVTDARRRRDLLAVSETLTARALAAPPR